MSFVIILSVVVFSMFVVVFICLFVKNINCIVFCSFSLIVAFFFSEEVEEDEEERKQKKV